MNDTIYRCQAIDTMQMLIDSLDKESPAYKSLSIAFDRCIIELKRMPSAQPHWIPCSERLPEIKENHVSDTVICYCSNGAYAFSQLQENIFGQCNFECERDDEYYEAVGDVIAWMPLPKPYGGESDETD